MKEQGKQWTEDMGEISGFGGGYEAVCRAMMLASIRWLDEHPDANLQYEGFKNVFGLVCERSPDAEALEKAMMDAPVFLNEAKIHEHARDNCTGAMYHAIVTHCLAYKRLGWDEYCRQLRESETLGADEPI